MAVGIAWLGNIFEFIDAATADYRTGIGEQRIVVLKDGTRIHLNTDTAINAVLAEGRRDLHLVKGEVSFVVAHDPDRTFTVHTGQVQSRALGTVFTVRHQPDRVTITVIEHAVQVEHSPGEIPARRTVQEGQQVHYTAQEGLSTVRPIAVGRETAWQRGKLIFEAQSLATVVNELNRYRHGRIIILNPALRALKVTGVFDAHDPPAALRMIQDTLHIKETSLTSYLSLLH